MSMVVLALMKDAHEARGLVRALDDAGFSGDDIDLAGDLVSTLGERGVSKADARGLAEAVRHGACIVAARAEDEGEATEAAQVMSAHGALGVSTGIRRS